jgi:glutathione synthase/RimK-type ligase-like ATP-grasp enzyme
MGRVGPVAAKIAIHERDGSFSGRWVEYCEQNHIPYKIVNCHANDICAQLQDVEALLWHWAYQIPSDVMAAKPILRMAEKLGIKVYPNLDTCWHFDDKISQKYLLQFIGAPLVPTFIFYDQNQALTWIGQTSFPKVFKLSKGAGSANVRLVSSAAEAATLVKKAFGPGIAQSSGYFLDLNKKVTRVKRRKDYLGVLTRMPKAVLDARKRNSQRALEKNYVYFQEFIPNNKFDTRITIIGKRAFGFTRNVRNNDFRASGSGVIVYDTARVDPQCIQIAFDIAERIGSQSLAFDFVKTADCKPMIVEVSYGFNADAVHACSGYWDKDLNWHAGQYWPQDVILMDLMSM